MKKEITDFGDIVSEDIEVVNAYLKLELESEPITYAIGKKEFVVTPKYREDSTNTVNAVLLKLMKNDSENR